MLDQAQLRDVMGGEAYGPDGEKIGKVGQVYLDDRTETPSWVTINTGMFGTNESFVPVQQATFSGDRLTVPYDKKKIKDAPNVAPDGHITPDEEQKLYAYYGMDYAGTADMGTADMGTAGYTETGTTGRTTTSDTGRDTDDAMTRSEERLDVGTTSEEVGRARLRKYVVTENVTETVPVRKEKAVLETEPITDANRDEALSGPEISEAEHEVTLREERPVVDKETVPVERVRVGKEEVTDQETVSEEVRKERIEAEGDVDKRR